MYDLGRCLIKWGVICLLIAGASTLVNSVFES
jgi:hypothetical protein